MANINQPTSETTHVATLNGHTAYLTPDTFTAVCDRLVKQAGGGVPDVQPYKPTKANSTWTDTVHDAEAEQRIKAQHDTLNKAGVKVDAGQQFYATGTRLADEGYAHQAAEQREHEKLQPAREAAADLVRRVQAEKRREIEITAGNLSRTIEANGKLRAAGGFALSEQAIRGLIARLRSPALGYVLGVRDRIVEEHRAEEPNKAAITTDKAILVDVLRHECSRNPDAALKLRVREAIGDCFAIVSPSYEPADAPEVLSQILSKLPKDARASYSYDPTSTTWELRAQVWTPTPVDKQAVGEAFQGYVSFSSRDNGTRSFRGGGGVLLLRCLNASTYVAEGKSTKRRHVGEILIDVQDAIDGGLHAIQALVEAWKLNREDVIDVPSGLSVQDVIPDFYTSLLTDRSSELCGVLRGRTAQHVEGLTAAFHEQRRDPEQLIRSDLVQGWTRYVQSEEPDIRREAEAAAGAWLVNRTPIRLPSKLSAN